MHTVQIEKEFQVAPFDENQAAEWDELVGKCPMGTFLHTRRFLNYNAERFIDRSLIIRRNNQIVAVFPAGSTPHDASTVISHPGATFGGIVHDGSIRGESALACLTEIHQHLTTNLGCEKLIYKPVPWIYHTIPSQDDVYALFRLGAHRWRCDMSSSIDLRHPPVLSSRRQRSLKKADQAGVTLSSDPKHLDEFWEVLSSNLKSRFDKTPVHSLAEIQKLQSLFPEHIKLSMALLSGQVIAGVVMFNGPSVAHAQYLAADDEGKRTSALDKAIMGSIDEAMETGKHFFDFGISTDMNGTYLNAGLYTYKMEFGAGATIFESYSL